MKILTLLIALFVMPLSVTIQAKGIREISQAVQQPIEIKAGDSRLMHVVFTHTVHKGINCGYCHHNVSTTGRYVQCITCHRIPGARERAPISMFMAYHSKSNPRSCIGCHSRLATDESKYSNKFSGCRPCHMSPGMRRAMQNADATK